MLNNPLRSIDSLNFPGKKTSSDLSNSTIFENAISPRSLGLHGVSFIDNVDDFEPILAYGYNGMDIVRKLSVTGMRLQSRQVASFLVFNVSFV
ncbi:unnamed protein product [Protopolystoma xenopodis]|uniref:Uncharacterized protein n=1 Tax=Protopolystoma xenopodis TaxID=117903 RepID=A0A448WAE5_9PLAT|nr:unnamed protein product [Protopolystoma xenopodis]